MKVLLIEDDFDLSRMYREQLEQAGHTVLAAYDVYSALDVLEREAVAAIVLDLLLPHVNGLALLQELRSWTDWRTIPVIILSNISPRAAGLNAKQLRQFGVQTYLIKAKTTPQALAAAVTSMQP